MRVRSLGLLALLLLPGCATIIDGTTQTVTVRTAPVGATCSVLRGPDTLGTIAATPGTILLHRERPDLTVVCDKPGWERSVTTIPSKFTGVTVGNLFVGKLVGVVVDEATRANYRYDQYPIIELTPQTPAGYVLPPRTSSNPPRPLADSSRSGLSG